MDYQQAKRAIAAAMYHIGREITRPEAVAMLSGDARKAAQHNNPLNSDIIGFRVIGPHVVEVALADFTSMRGGTYMAGVTVFGNHDLSECVSIDKLSDKLRSLASKGAGQ